MKIIFLISAVLLMIISILLYMGKVSNMIAGYNTMSQNEKAKYDEIKICKILAMTFSVVALILILGSINIISFNDTLIISIVIFIIGSILGNIIPKK